jgi:ABC-type uncharacterized transport system permease subunit
MKNVDYDPVDVVFYNLEEIIHYPIRIYNLISAACF